MGTQTHGDMGSMESHDLAAFLRGSGDGVLTSEAVSG